jgi:AAA domain
MEKRGASGVPLPSVYPKLASAGVSICRSELTLVVGPPSAGKSLLVMNLAALMGQPALAFLLDTNPLSASARFISIVTRESYATVKAAIVDGDGERYRGVLTKNLSHLQASFHATGPDDVEREVLAFEQRYGLPPEAIVVDNLGNMASALENEWGALKALTLEFDGLAKKAECAVIATAHTADLGSLEPAQRSKILGKISQYPALILSVGFNPQTGDYKVAAVKNREGRSDVNADSPAILYADPARMLIQEEPPYRPPAAGRSSTQEETSTDWWDK